MILAPNKNQKKAFFNLVLNVEDLKIKKDERVNFVVRIFANKGTKNPFQNPYPTSNFHHHSKQILDLYIIHTFLNFNPRNRGGRTQRDSRTEPKGTMGRTQLRRTTQRMEKHQVHAEPILVHQPPVLLAHRAKDPGQNR